MVKVLLRCMQMSTDGMQLKPAASLSGGMKRRLSLAIAAIGIQQDQFERMDEVIGYL